MVLKLVLVVSWLIVLAAVGAVVAFLVMIRRDMRCRPPREVYGKSVYDPTPALERWEAEHRRKCRRCARDHAEARREFEELMAADDRPARRLVATAG